METKFAKCELCGNVAEVANGEKAPLECCGQRMTKLEVKTADAGAEKHVPVVSRDGNVVTVAVGDVPHPMTRDHLIEFIVIVDGNKTYRAELAADQEPKAQFIVENAEVSVYSYCNIHGMWGAKG